MKKEEFMRVATTVYKIVDRPSLTGGFHKVLQPWTYEALRQDYGKEFVASIPKYDGFCIIPCHTDYQEVIGNHLNLYESFKHEPTPGECETVLYFIRHIFREHYELGLDYIQLLYQQPTVKLPILLLVSKERNTGKTTFLNFLKAIFGGNMTFNTNEDFRSQFNADWTNKLIVAVDEVLLDRKEDSERLKNLSTALLHKTEAKGKDRSESQFFGKFILCSNNENNPIIIDYGETRYWVRKIIPFKEEKTNILSDLKKEIPQFLYFLNNRKMTTKSESRMWFHPDLYKTEALKRIIACNRNRLEIELRELLLDIMETTGEDKLQFCLNDIVRLLQDQSIKADRNLIRKIFLYEWKLEVSPNSLTYYAYEYNYHSDTSFSKIRRIGRYYTVDKGKLLSF